MHGTPSTSTTAYPFRPQPLIVSSCPPAREPKAGLTSSILGNTLTYQQSSPAKLQWRADPSRITELPARNLATGVSDLEGNVSSPTVTVNGVAKTCEYTGVSSVILYMSVLKMPILMSSIGFLFSVRPLLLEFVAQLVMVRNWISCPAQT